MPSTRSGVGMLTLRESMPPSVGASLRDSHPRLGETRSRTAMTLIELLVVIIILTTLVAAAIPLLSPTNDERRLREASRGLNSFIAAAQAKAVQLQRPFGIALKKLSQDTGRDDPPTNLSDPNDPGYRNDNGVCLEVFYVEQPPALTGFSETSAARVASYVPDNPNWYGGFRQLVVVQFVARGTTYDMAQDGLPMGWDADPFPGPNASSVAGGVIRPGDVIELNGTQFELLANTNDADVQVRLDATGKFFASNTGKLGGDPANAVTIVARAINDTGQMIRVEYDNQGRPLDKLAAVTPVPESPFWTFPAPYKILRQPARTSAPPYQLPDGTAIDLRASGIGDDDYFYVPNVYDNSSDAIVMFAPEGSVQRVRYNQKAGDDSVADIISNEPAAANLYLLVGRRVNVPPLVVDNDPTLTMSDSDWNDLTDQQRQEFKEPINWLRAESRWIVIGSQSGRVVTAENAFVDPAAMSDPTFLEEERTEQIRAARTFARELTQTTSR